MKRLVACLVVTGLASSCYPALSSPTPASYSPEAGDLRTATPFRPLLPTSAVPTLTPLATHVWPIPFSFGHATPPATAIPTPVDAHDFEPDVVNILLLGVDQENSGGIRTDTLVLLSIHRSARGAALISIPRDLYVYIPGYSMQRINTAYMLGEALGYPGGGRSMLKDTFLYNLGIPVDYIAMIDMSGFQGLIDRLGGIDVDVSCSYTDWRLKEPGLPAEDEGSWALFTVSTGVVHMDGDYALWYARARSRSSDFDRARRQQEVLRAIYRQIFRLDLIPRLPGLYDELTGMLTTDIPLDVLVDLAVLAPWMDLAQVRSRFIGRDQVTSWRVPVSGAQVLLPQPEAIRALLDDALNFSQQDPLVPRVFPTVEVINASSQPDWDRLAAARLNYAGFRAHIGTAEPAEGSLTRLVDYGMGTQQQREEILQVLGLGEEALVSEDDPTSAFLFTLLVGDDYSPCYNPTRNQGN